MTSFIGCLSYYSNLFSQSFLSFSWKIVWIQFIVKSGEVHLFLNFFKNVRPSHGKLWAMSVEVRGKRRGYIPHAQLCITDNKLQLNVYDIKEKIIIIDSNLNPWQLIRELYLFWESKPLLIRWFKIKQVKWKSKNK